MSREDVVLFLRGTKSPRDVYNFFLKAMEATEKAGITRSEALFQLSIAAEEAYMDGHIVHADQTRKLANPYHDELGRFTNAKNAVVAIGVSFGKNMIRESAELMKSKMFRAALYSALGLQVAGNVQSVGSSAERKRSVQGVYKKIPGRLRHPRAVVRTHPGELSYVVSGRGSPTSILSFGFVTRLGNRNAHISPFISHLLGKKDKTNLERRRAEHTVAHELVHTRRRTKRRGALSYVLGMSIEEGFTDTISSKYTRWGSPGYKAYSDAVSTMALKVGGSRTKAMKWIEDKHLAGSRWMDVSRDLSAALGTNVSPFHVFAYVKNGRGKLAKLIGSPDGGYNKLTGIPREKGKINMGRFWAYAASGIPSVYVAARAKRALISAVLATAQEIGMGGSDGVSDATDAIRG